MLFALDFAAHEQRRHPLVSRLFVCIAIDAASFLQVVMVSDSLARRWGAKHLAFRSELCLHPGCCSPTWIWDVIGIAAIFLVGRLSHTHTHNTPLCD